MSAFAQKQTLEITRILWHSLSTSIISFKTCFQIASKNETGIIGDTQGRIKLLILFRNMVPPHGLEPRTP